MPSPEFYANHVVIVKVGVEDKKTLFAPVIAFEAAERMADLVAE